MTNLEIEWLGQASFIYRFPQGMALCTDPYLSYTGKTATRERLLPIPIPAQQLETDIVIITHDHYDHFDEASIRPLVETPERIFLGPSSCLDHWLAMGLPEKRFLRLDQGESLDIAGTELTAVYAKHDSGAVWDAIGVILRTKDFCVYHVGDSEYDERLVEEVKGLKPDVLSVPINGRLGNMGHEEAAQLTQAVAPRVAIPMHYGMFANNNAHPLDFVDACRKLNVAAHVVLMKPGRCFRLESL